MRNGGERPQTTTKEPVMDEDQIAYQMRKAARVADVGETTIKTWVREGLLPVSRIGGIRLIKRSDLLALLDAHQG